VDFILYGERGLLAFEIKRTGRLTGAHYRGLRAFIKDYPMAKSYLLYGGRRGLSEGPINVRPMEAAFLELPNILSRPNQ
jgi:hypothetical protein